MGAIMELSAITSDLPRQRASRPRTVSMCACASIPAAVPGDRTRVYPAPVDQRSREETAIWQTQSQTLDGTVYVLRIHAQTETAATLRTSMVWPVLDTRRVPHILSSHPRLRFQSERG